MKRHRFLFIVSLIILTDLSFCSQVNAKVILEVSKYYEIPFAVLQLASKTLFYYPHYHN